jgi:hypothetical protein
MAAVAPRIITARSIGLSFQNLFGTLGPELNVTGHYSATPRAKNVKAGIDATKSFHRDHMNRGWGGIGYHYVIPDDGVLICARPTLLKGAHTFRHNSQNIGVNMPGTTGDRPTPQQQATYQWLLANAHTALMPRAHRTDRDLREARLMAHKLWPDQSTACPGLFQPMYLAGLGKAPVDAGDEEAQPEPEAPPETMHGTTVADGIFVSAEEAEQARNTDDVEAELPEADPEFDEEHELEKALR